MTATPRSALLLKRNQMTATVQIQPIAVLLERLARREHARLAWIQRDQAHVVPRHHGEFADCSHAECVAVKQALDAKP
jgi:hypothetical protein